ncbi:ACP S-malonyltransferase [bacterium]|nr:ACP S-malonyltransferase [bacterium]
MNIFLKPYYTCRYMKKYAAIFPGQGSQKPLMGKSFYDTYLVSKEAYQEAEEILSMNITRELFSSNGAMLERTDFCQVALFVTLVAIWKALDVEGLPLAVSAGLSLGEYAALVAAKKVTFQEALPLIKKRGEWMQKAAESSSQGMIAVLGMDAREIPKKYQIANLNCPGQVVLAGSKEEMQQAKVELKQKGAKRVLSLKVFGAFHSSYMQPVKNQLSPLIEHLPLLDSSIDLVMNVTGKKAASNEEIQHNLKEQVTGTTLWHASVLTMEEYGVDYIEIGPTKLAGMNKKIGTKRSTISIEEVKDLEQIYEKV